MEQLAREREAKKKEGERERERERESSLKHNNAETLARDLGSLNTAEQNNR